MPPPLNICLISREYPPFFGGGIGSYTQRWAHLLADAGHRTLVITVCDDGQTRREREGDLTILRLPLVRARDWSAPDPSISDPFTRAAFRAFSPVAVFAMQVAEHLPALQQEFNFDLIEAPDTGALHWFALNHRRTCGDLAAGGPAPALWLTCIHSPTEWISRWNNNPPRTRQDHELLAMERDCISWSDALLCPSRAMAAEAAALWNLAPEQITIIPYPLGDLEHQSAAHANSSTTDPNRFLYTGRLEPRKGIETLLAAFAQALATGADVHLDLVGEDIPEPGSWRPHGQRCLNQYIPAEHRARVRLHGKLPPEQVADFQARAAAIVIPSPMDNFPNTCIEAMAHGKLVIAAGAGGMAEMIEHERSGLLFEPGNPASCAAALTRAAAMTALQSIQLGEAAARRIRAVCGNTTILEQRLAHMHAVLEQKRGRPARAPAQRKTLIINPAPATQQDLDALAAAIANPDIDFAHAWLRRGDHAEAFSTPTLHSLALTPRDLGPLAIAADSLPAAAHALLRPTATPDHYTCDSTLALALLCAADGKHGAVLPHIRIALPAAALPASDTATTELAHTRAELARIHSSRGWRLLQFIYRVLHIIKSVPQSKRPTTTSNSSSPPGPLPYHPPAQHPESARA
jgi:glycosyltransferase involved in cell wall biosynthesis